MRVEQTTTVDGTPLMQHRCDMQSLRLTRRLSVETFWFRNALALNVDVSWSSYHFATTIAVGPLAVRAHWMRGNFTTISKKSP